MSAPGFSNFQNRKSGYSWCKTQVSFRCIVSLWRFSFWSLQSFYWSLYYLCLHYIFGWNIGSCLIREQRDCWVLMHSSRNTRLISYHLHCAFCNLILSLYRLMYAKKWLWINIMVQVYTRECKGAFRRVAKRRKATKIWRHRQVAKGCNRSQP